MKKNKLGLLIFGVLLYFVLRKKNNENVDDFDTIIDSGSTLYDLNGINQIAFFNNKTKIISSYGTPIKIGNLPNAIKIKVKDYTGNILNGYISMYDLIFYPKGTF